MIKGIYKKGVLRPLKKLDLEEGEEIEIEIKARKNPIDQLTKLIDPKDEVINEAIEIVEDEVF